MAKVPARSTSRKVQRQHKRRIKTSQGYKDVLINRGVKKSSPTRTGNTRLTPQPGPRTAIRTSSKGTGLPLKPSDSKTSGLLRPKLRWQDVIKPQKGETAIEKAAKKIKGLDEVRKSLQPGERIAVDYTIETQGPMSTMGTFIGRDEQGNEFRYTINHQMSNGSLLDYIYESSREGTPIIIQTAKNEYVGDFVHGARPAEKIMPSDTIPYYEVGYAIMPSPTKKNPDRVIVTREWGDGNETARAFNSYEDVHVEEEKLAKLGLNIFMEPLSPQKKLDEFKRRKQ